MTKPRTIKISKGDILTITDSGIELVRDVGMNRIQIRRFSRKEALRISVAIQSYFQTVPNAASKRKVQTSRISTD